MPFLLPNQLYQSTEGTHTHPFNGPLSGTTRVSRYQKGKTNLDFTEARDSEWQWNPLGHMQIYTSLQTDNHANTSPLSFLQARFPSCRPTNSVKALKAIFVIIEHLQCIDYSGIWCQWEGKHWGMKLVVISNFHCGSTKHCNLTYWHCPHTMQSRVSESVHLFVRLSVLAWATAAKFVERGRQMHVVPHCQHT